MGEVERMPLSTVWLPDRPIPSCLTGPYSSPLTVGRLLHAVTEIK